MEFGTDGEAIAGAPITKLPNAISANAMLFIASSDDILTRAYSQNPFSSPGLYPNRRTPDRDRPNHDDDANYHRTSRGDDATIHDRANHPRPNSDGDDDATNTDGRPSQLFERNATSQSRTCQR